MMLSKTQFGHAIGRIRALENIMLSQNDVERMILAHDVKEAFKVLNETSFSHHMLDIDRVEDFQEVIDAELKDTKAFIKDITPNSWILNIVFYLYDIHNIKSILKAKSENIDEEMLNTFLSALGTIDPEKIKHFIQTENAKFPETEIEEHRALFEETTEEVLQKLNKGADFQIIDLILDSLYFTLIQSVERMAKDEFLSAFVKKQIDIFNLEALLRIKITDAQIKQEDILVEGGNLAKEDLLKASEKELKEMSQQLKDFKGITQTVINEYEEFGTLSSLSILSQNLMTEFMQAAKMTLDGPGPVVAFLYGKLNNAQIIRTVLLAKIAGIDPEKIKPHLKELY